MILNLSAADWFGFFTQFAMLSLLSVGGAITTAPDMHRYLVTEQHWLTESQFTSCISLAQAAPGPNVLFVALMGWNVGLNAGGGLHAGWTGLAMALFGVLVPMLGIMIPSTTLTFVAARWGHQNRELRVVRAFKQGMAPIVIALLIATGWLLISANNNAAKDWPLWLLGLVCMLLVWKTKIHLLWLLGAGALLGAFGLV